MARDLVEVRGEVQSTNDKGFKINDEWKNYSRYFKGDRVSRGDQVVAKCDGNFVNELTVVSSGGGSTGSSQGGSTASSGGSAGGNRDKTIQRQVALKAAVELCNTNGTIAGMPTTEETAITVSRAFEAYLGEPFEAVEDVGASY